MPTAVVTGANGFIGGPVCRLLVAQGWRVIGAIRRTAAAPDLPDGVEPRLISNVADYVDWERHLRDADAVVHLVARSQATGEYGTSELTEFRRANVAATRQLVQAARRTSVRRFVFLSAIQAVGRGSLEAYSERSVCEPRDAYGRSRLEAEQGLFEDARGTRIEPIVLRPPLVYGPGVRGEFLRLLDCVAGRVPLPLAGVDAVRSLISVDNLASAVAFVLRHRDAVGHVYHVADDDSISGRELALRLGALLETSPRMFPCPVAALRIVARLTGRFRLAAGLTRSLKVDARTIREVLGWRPPQSLDEGLRATVAWYRRDVLRQPAQSAPANVAPLAAESAPRRAA